MQNSPYTVCTHPYICPLSCILQMCKKCNPIIYYKSSVIYFLLLIPIMQRLCIKYRPIKPLRHQSALSKINTFKKRYLLYTLLYFFAYCCGKCVNNHKKLSKIYGFGFNPSILVVEMVRNTSLGIKL